MMKNQIVFDNLVRPTMIVGQYAPVVALLPDLISQEDLAEIQAKAKQSAERLLSLLNS